MRSNRRLVLALCTVLLTAGGCAVLPPQQRAASARAVHPDRPCPPPGLQPLERDLTMPWASRTYLLEDGSRCRPDAE